MTTATINTATTAQKAADALVGLIPTTTPLSASLSASVTGAQQSGASALVATFVGDTSADLAVVVLDQSSLVQATEGGAVQVADVLTPALEAAGATIGTGTLSRVTQEDASALFTDPDSYVFDLTGAGSTVAGWFAIRLRKPVAGTSHSEGPLPVAKLSRIAGVDMTMAVEVGRTRMTVRDVLELEPGVVVELDRSAGAPADVLLNGQLLARGEIVVVDGGDYAVRITKVEAED